MSVALEDLANTISRMYTADLKSTTQISKILGISLYYVRKSLKQSAISLRSAEDGLRLRSDVLGKHLIGKKRPQSESQIEKIREKAIKRWSTTAKGTSKKKSGYVVVTRGVDEGKGVHVVLMERRIGRKLKKDEVVHHIDGNRSNNDENNLAMMTRSAHNRLHRYQDKISGNERRRDENGRYI